MTERRISSPFFVQASDADELSSTARTIEHYVNNASRELGTSIRQHTVAEAPRSGQVQPD